MIGNINLIHASSIHPSTHLTDTMKIEDTIETLRNNLKALSRHNPDTYKTPSKHSQNTLQTISRHSQDTPKYTIYIYNCGWVGGG